MRLARGIACGTELHGKKVLFQHPTVCADDRATAAALSRDTTRLQTEVIWVRLETKRALDLRPACRTAPWT